MSKRYNVILDLDSTVISSLRPWDPQPSGLIGHHMDEEFIVYERPGLQDFLNFLFKNFNVAVWTAASKDYAIFIVDNILLQNKNNRKLEFLLYDYHGNVSEEMTQIDCPKDLNLVWNTFPGFSSRNTLIIDDYDAVFAPQLCNAYPIVPFEASSSNPQEDRELLKLRKGLEQLKSQPLSECPIDHVMSKQSLDKILLRV